MQIQEDNQACIQIADNPISQRRTRHVDIRYHFVRDYIEDGTVTVKYWPTAQMLADIMTKMMPKPTFVRLRDKIIGDVMQFIKPDFLLKISYCQALYARLPYGLGASSLKTIVNSPSRSLQRRDT